MEVVKGNINVCLVCLFFVSEVANMNVVFFWFFLSQTVRGGEYEWLLFFVSEVANMIFFFCLRLPELVNMNGFYLIFCLRGGKLNFFCFFTFCLRSSRGS